MMQTEHPLIGQWVEVVFRWQDGTAISKRGRVTEIDQANHLLRINASIDLPVAGNDEYHKQAHGVFEIRLDNALDSWRPFQLPSDHAILIYAVTDVHTAPGTVNHLLVSVCTSTLSAAVCEDKIKQRDNVRYVYSVIAPFDVQLRESI
jgi:hypothetical protein